MPHERCYAWPVRQVAGPERRGRGTRVGERRGLLLLVVFDESVLLEQLLEAGHAREILGSQPVMEPSQIALGLRGGPARLGLLARDLGKRGEARGERGVEKFAQLGL